MPTLKHFMPCAAALGINVLLDGTACQLSQLETLAGIEQRLRTKNLGDLKQKIASLLDKVPHNPNVPSWDQL